MAGGSLVSSAAEPSSGLRSSGLYSGMELDVDPVKQHMMKNNANFLKETIVVFFYSKCPSTDEKWH